MLLPGVEREGQVPARARALCWGEEARSRKRARLPDLWALLIIHPAERAQLHALAARGLAGTHLSLGAVYVINLVRVYKALMGNRHSSFVYAQWEELKQIRLARAPHPAPRQSRQRDEVANVAALLIGPNGGFITGSDVLMDGGVTAAYWFGEVAEVRTA